MLVSAGLLVAGAAINATGIRNPTAAELDGAATQAPSAA
jgi:hypothetical protein